MDIGVFMMPSHPPERPLREGYEWDLRHLELCDRLGFSEAWIGEHFTSPWEPNPAPDLLIAQALLRTRTMKLAPGAHLLPFHHPAELAHRVAFLDHMAEGRFMFGVGSSGLPSDWRLFNVDGMKGDNRKMTREALDIILRLWSDDEPFEYRGEYWNVNGVEPMFGLLNRYLKPFQKPHPPIGIAGLSPNSDTLVIAGERGFMPMSLNINATYLASHWASVEKGAESVGRTPNRADWKLVREVYVAETDREARRKAIEGPIGRAYREYLLPLFGNFGFLGLFKHDPAVPDSDVSPEYLCEYGGWLVGSPSTVRQRLADMEGDAGGFGTLLVLTFDHLDDDQGWAASQRLMIEEVMPHFRDRKAA
jgi:alkanesulfonate monooxygenase SsuD/methylene tetrahydromethanopterin reductase-like flavin-dependent oxidoreductase (luciferase family)